MSIRTLSSEPLLDLTSGRVDLWYTRIDHVAPGLAQGYYAWLTPEELLQHGRFYFEKDRHRYLLTRALVREVLSRYAPVSPEGWRFAADRYGKPYIVELLGLAPQIAFNISHTDDLVVLGVTLGRALGVDVECTQRKAPLEVAERFFSEDESRRLRSLPAHAQAIRFWELWTLKESYIKARGMGLSLPLDQFSFELDEPGSISIQFAHGFGDTPSLWQFWQLRPSECHLLSVCVGASNEGAVPIRLSVRETTPLRSSRLVQCPLQRSPRRLREAAGTMGA